MLLNQQNGKVNTSVKRVPGFSTRSSLSRKSVKSVFEKNTNSNESLDSLISFQK